MFEEVGEEWIGSASGLDDLQSKARRLRGSWRGRVSRGEAPTASVAAASGPARSCEGCPLDGGAAVSRGLSPEGEAPTVSVAVEKAALG